MEITAAMFPSYSMKQGQDTQVSRAKRMGDWINVLWAMNSEGAEPPPPATPDAVVIAAAILVATDQTF